MRLIVSNRVAYTFVALGIIILIAFGITAYDVGPADEFGHDIEKEIDPPVGCETDQVLQWTSSGWGCVDGGQWYTIGTSKLWYPGRVGIQAYPSLETDDVLTVGGSISFDGSLRTRDSNSRIEMLRSSRSSAWLEVEGIRVSGTSYDNIRPDPGDIIAEGEICADGGSNCIGDGGSSLWTDGSGGAIYYDDGNVGIGDTTPTEAKLVIAGTSGTEIYSTSIFNIAGAHNMFLTPSGDLHLQAGGTNTRIFADDATGNVGIGTTSPQAKLHVSDSGDTKARVESTASHAGLELHSVGNDWIVQAQDNGNLRIYDQSSSSERITIEPGGDVIIQLG